MKSSSLIKLILWVTYWIESWKLFTTTLHAWKGYKKGFYHIYLLCSISCLVFMQPERFPWICIDSFPFLNTLLLNYPKYILSPCSYINTHINWYFHNCDKYEHSHRAWSNYPSYGMQQKWEPTNICQTWRVTQYNRNKGSNIFSIICQHIAISFVPLLCYMPACQPTSTCFIGR